MDELGDRVSCETLTEINFYGVNYPIALMDFNPDGPEDIPTLVLVGGVHGLERIGSQVILAYLQTVSAYLKWDELFQELFRRMRLIVIPFLNPTGMLLQTRANANGVDIMRNAPINGEEPTTLLTLYRGHRISPVLPWYRGRKNTEMEAESIALCDVMTKRVFKAKTIVSLDVHSGFGSVDRLWFPYAGSRKPIDRKVELFALKKLLDQTLPNHVYQVEPQCHQYTTHGDLWDHLYHIHRDERQDGTFLPLTLEMGSWRWLRKNPFQIFSPLGLFHPMKQHRIRRVMRRHGQLLMFLIRATAFSKIWVDLDPKLREEFSKNADHLWDQP